jgi:hypothetical protein
MAAIHLSNGPLLVTDTRYWGATSGLDASGLPAANVCYPGLNATPTWGGGVAMPGWNLGFTQNEVLSKAYQ